MDKIRDFLKCYLYITVGILIVIAISYAFSSEETVSADSFWQILLSGFLTTLVTVIFSPFREHIKVRIVAKFALHYVSLCLVMFICGSWFGWMTPNPAGAAIMMLDVGVVYLFVVAAVFLIDVSQAREINKRLQEKYGGEEN